MSNTTHHTPAPWNLTFNGRGRPVVQREGCPPLWVETLQYGKGGPFDDDALREIADAQLISAAPDLLKALQMAEGEIEALLSELTLMNPERENHNEQASLRAIRAAIDAARKAKS
jgi:hypothetical protein